MEKLRQLDWSLIVGLGSLALVHPLLNVTGLMERLGRPLGPLLVTATVSAIWAVTVVLSRVRAPLATLALTGLAAGLAVVAVDLLLATGRAGEVGGLFLGPVGAVAVLVVHTLWGTLAGLLVLALRRALRASGGQ